MEHRTEQQARHCALREKAGMTELELVERLCRLFKRLTSDFDWGDELNGDIEEMEALCHQYREELKNRDFEKDTDGDKAS